MKYSVKIDAKLDTLNPVERHLIKEYTKDAAKLHVEHSLANDAAKVYITKIAEIIDQNHHDVTHTKLLVKINGQIIVQAKTQKVEE